MDDPHPYFGAIDVDDDLWVVRPSGLADFDFEAGLTRSCHGDAANSRPFVAYCIAVNRIAHCGPRNQKGPSSGGLRWCCGMVIPLWCGTGRNGHYSEASAGRCRRVDYDVRSYRRAVSEAGLLGDDDAAVESAIRRIGNPDRDVAVARYPDPVH